MENNKFLINIRFPNYNSQNKKFEDEDLYAFDIDVLRDITLKQLMDGIYFGLEKKISVAGKVEAKKLKWCQSLVRTKPVGDSYLHMQLYHYNYSNAKRFLTSKDVFAFREDAKLNVDQRNCKLCDIGFITSTQLLFFDLQPALSKGKSGVQDFVKVCTSDVAGSIFNTQNVVPAFRPTLGNRIQYPEYNISTREIYQFDKESVKVLPPTDPPAKPDDNVFASLLPSMITMGVMMLARSVGFGGDKSALGRTVLMTVLMMGASFFGGVLLARRKKRDYILNLRNWRHDYQKYINRLMETVKKRQEKDVAKLNELYPDADLLANNDVCGIQTFSDRIFSRSFNDPDFLTFRLGESMQVKSLFEIDGESVEQVSPKTHYVLGKEDKIKIYLNEERSRDKSHPLCALPGDLRQRFSNLPKAPLLYSLKNSGVLGIVDPTVTDGDPQLLTASYSYIIKRMIFDLCLHHSPEDLQFVMFFDRNTQKEQYRMITYDYRYLPHFNGLFSDISQFVFTEDSANAVFSRMLMIMNERSKGEDSNDENDETTSQNKSESAPKRPHIVFILFDEYHLKEHIFAQYLPVAPEINLEKPYENQYGLSFVFVAQYKEYLPMYCTDIIRLNDTESTNTRKKQIKESDAEISTMTLTPRNNIGEKKYFCIGEYKGGEISVQRAEKLNTRYKNAFSFFAAIYYTRISENGKVPSSVNLFELINPALSIKKKQRNAGSADSKWTEKDIALKPNDEIEYEVTVSNSDLSSSAASGFIVEDTIPKGFRYLGSSGRAIQTGNTLRWRIEDVAGADGVGIGASVTFTYKLRAQTNTVSDVISYLPHILSQQGSVKSNLENLIQRNWGLGATKPPIDITKSLRVPVGKTETGIAYLDIHEKEDGPHMLVAGTTGSGKSETIISWLIALCIQFSPSELNLLLVDMKGGGFTKRLGHLPHVVGTVTDVDGDENGTGSAYMLRRFLNAMTSEIKRRKILLNKLYVDNADDYIRACRNIEAHIEKKKIPKDEQEEVRNLAKQGLSHLILVIDEFTELKRFSSENDNVDFIGEITTIARIGRSLGCHICLISQNIQGAITEDISVNSKSRLCLKVATAQASKEMIGSDKAADPSMPLCGRAYLLVGTGSKLVYFQSAYSAAKMLSEEGSGIEDAAFQIQNVAETGFHSTFYDSSEDNTEINSKIDQLSRDGKLKTQLEETNESIVNVYDEGLKQHKLIPPYKVFCEPLKRSIALGEKDKVVEVTDF